MRQLTDEELTLLFEKLKKFIGPAIKDLIEDCEPENGSLNVFRLIKNRVYLISEVVLKKAAAFGTKPLLHCGTCLGQFSKSGKFRMGITALDTINRFAQTRVWLKSTGEQNYLYGNHVLKAHVARISENATKYCGVVVLTLSNLCLGFGVLAKSSQEFNASDSTMIYVFNQADTGEYLRVESDKNRKKEKYNDDDEEDEEDND